MRLIRLYATLFSLALRRQVTFRADFGFEFGSTVIGVVASLAALLVVFTRTDHLGGFTPPQAAVLLGTFQVVSALRQALVEPNLRFNGEQVQDGSFDAILTQPAPPIFLASLGSAAPLALGQAILGAGVIGVALTRLPTRPDVLRLLGWVVVLAAAVVIMWAARCIIAAGVFWAPKLTLDVAFDAAWQLGGYPTTMLGRSLRLALTYIVPVAFLATVPTAVLTGRFGPGWVVAAVLAAAASSAAAILAWDRGLTRYSSATS